MLRVVGAVVCAVAAFGLPGDRQAGSPTGPVIAHGPAVLPRIALTFDSNMTDAMLRSLDSGKVKSYANVAVIDELQRSRTPATFFLAGKWVERYPALTHRIAADPSFELASHSYAHIGFTDHCYHLGKLPTDQMAADVEHSFRVLAPFGGRQTGYFRFPGGCYDPTALRAIVPAHSTVIQYDIVGGHHRQCATARAQRWDRRPAHHPSQRPAHRRCTSVHHHRTAGPRIPPGHAVGLAPRSPLVPMVTGNAVPP